jgi:Sulfotransferase domain
VAVRGGVRVVYIGGLGRSGSTLLEQLLGKLPGVCAAGEVVHLWQRGIVADEMCGCGEPFSACDFWSQVGAVAFGGWQNVSLERLSALRGRVDRTRFIPLLEAPKLSARTRQNLAEYTNYYRRVYQAIAAVSGCTTVIDSSKHASLAFCLGRSDQVDLRVVHLVRDSRAVAFSWTTRVPRPEGGAGSYMATYHPVTAAFQWNAQNAALQGLARRGTPVLRVRYEDFVDSVQPTIAAVARFAGLPESAVTPGGADQSAPPAADDGRAHTVSGNPIRLSAGPPIIRRDERWRQAMPQVHRRQVTALTLPLLTHYGYDWRTA